MGKPLVRKLFNLSAAGHTGIMSVLLKTSYQDYDAWLKQRVVGISPFKKYKVQGYAIKGTDLNLAKIRVAFYSTGGTSQIGTPIDSSEVYPSEWTLLEIGEITPPSGASEMEVRLTLKKSAGSSSGSAYFDDISVFEISP